MKKGKRETVFVGLSGGVDSSVAAARLQARGFNVVGVFIKVWHPDFMVCSWEQERLDAMRVAAHLRIPFLTCDAEAAYRDEVAHYFIEEYKAGRTPNPDVLCNQQVKFGAFLDFAKNKGADYIATGHYAQKIDSDTPELHRGIDSEKDQTYFLWTLSNEQLSSSLFPVGDTPKEVIRTEAKAAGLPVATKKDSQGVCFLGHVDIPDFLSHYIDLVPGAVLNTNGEIIGEHAGALVYTLGQRHGFTLNTNNTTREAMFVVDRDCKKNTITVAAEKEYQPTSALLTLTHTVLRTPLTIGETVEMQTRYRQTPFVGTVADIDTKTITLSPEAAIEKPAAGQSCVLYRGTLCLGGGMLV